jgi:hypothetical protein
MIKTTNYVVYNDYELRELYELLRIELFVKFV